uniref:Uncharacterized protein n=1 Tax=Arundo donax TaxID=35708 RepID=A0A0A8ZHL3_ARUDO
MRSMTIHHSESEASSSNGSPIHDLGRSRTEVARYPTQGATSTPSQLYEPVELNGKPMAPRSSINSWDELGRRSQSSWYDSSRNDNAVTISGSETWHQREEPDYENFSTPPSELVCFICCSVEEP